MHRHGHADLDLPTFTTVKSNEAGRNLRANMKSKVTSLQLIDANTDLPIVDLKNGMVITLDAIASGMNATTMAFNVNAVVNGTEIQSIKYGYNGNSKFRIEAVDPYAFCGNNGANFNKCKKLGLGEHTITATPYTGLKGDGKAGRPVSVTFTIIESDTASLGEPQGPFSDDCGCLERTRFCRYRVDLFRRGFGNEWGHCPVWQPYSPTRQLRVWLWRYRHVLARAQC